MTEIPKARGRRAPGSRLTQTEVDEIFARFQAANPDPETELFYNDNFTLLVAVVLSAQATDAGVNRATPGLFRAANTPEKMVALGESGVTDKIKTIGLYRNKAKNVVALSQKLVEEHDSEVPGTRDQLEALPGVGRKTANVVLNVAFGQPTIGIDTHAFRVANRTGLAPGKTPLTVEDVLNRIGPLCVQSAQARMLALHHRGHLPVQTEDKSAGLTSSPQTEASRQTSQRSAYTSAP